VRVLEGIDEREIVVDVVDVFDAYDAETVGELVDVFELDTDFVLEGVFVLSWVGDI